MGLCGGEPRGPKRGPKPGSCEGTWPPPCCTPFEILEKVIQEGRSTQLLDGDADCAPVHSNRGSRGAFVGRQKD